eukprot:TRINITY_DN18504_c0_g1_i3.p1 TRINITY_DN18504_c0_g1~~TRINITY_DN18504_c0_g1_i3.p1  ORF type:complete len:209 (-),score=49.76 TRINITY_DN18504_c0_g1_i3:83-709(-)
MDVAPGSRPEITSVMIRNLPTRSRGQEILDKIDELGFAGQCNFFYLPSRTSTTTGKAKALNLGFGFLNFKDSLCAERFMQVFLSSSVTLQRNSEKVLSACQAEAQGLALIKCTEKRNEASELWIEARQLYLFTPDHHLSKVGSPNQMARVLVNNGNTASSGGTLSALAKAYARTLPPRSMSSPKHEDAEDDDSQEDSIDEFILADPDY